jgi:hypothetical protein
MKCPKIKSVAKLLISMILQTYSRAGCEMAVVINQIQYTMSNHGVKLSLKVSYHAIQAIK